MHPSTNLLVGLESLQALTQGGVLAYNKSSLPRSDNLVCLPPDCPFARWRVILRLVEPQKQVRCA